MDETALIDWYDVVEAVANGRLTGHACPLCQGAVACEHDGAWVRVRCQSCNQGFEGRMGYGRDDAFAAEAAELVRRRSAPRVGATVEVETGPVVAPVAPEAPVAPDAPEPAPITRPEPWQWTLPADSGSDLDGLSLWMDVVQSIHNGRQSGLSCPFCSEPLDDIVVRRPHIRVRCQHCNEGFEGRIS